MSNESKFKIGDVVVRTKYITEFPYGDEPLVVTKVWPWYGRNLLTVRPSNQSWLEEDFELYVKQENQVPDNMEIVGYQLESPAGWIDVNKESYERSCKVGCSTRVLYTIKQANIFVRVKE